MRLLHRRRQYQPCQRERQYLYSVSICTLVLVKLVKQGEMRTKQGDVVLIPGVAVGERRAVADGRDLLVAYVSIRQHTPAYVGIRQHTPAYVGIRQHT